MKFKNLFSVFIQDTVHKRKKLTKKQCEEWLYLVAKNKSKVTLRIVDENDQLISVCKMTNIILDKK